MEHGRDCLVPKLRETLTMLRLVLISFTALMISGAAFAQVTARPTEMLERAPEAEAEALVFEGNTAEINQAFIDRGIDARIFEDPARPGFYLLAYGSRTFYDSRGNLLQREARVNSYEIASGDPIRLIEPSGTEPPSIRVEKPGRSRWRRKGAPAGPNP